MKTLNFNLKKVFIILALFATQFLFSQATFRCLEFSTPDDGIVIGDNGVVYKTVDGGLTWDLKTTFTNENLNKSTAADGDILVAVGNNGAIIRSIDMGLNWTPIASGTTTDLFGVYIGPSGIGYSVGRNGTLIKTDDHGQSWSTIMENHGSNLNAVSMSDDINGIIVGDKNTILLTNDGGLTWSNPPSMLSFEMNIKFVRMIDRSTIFATSTFGEIIRSRDAGNSWEVVYSNSAKNAFYRVNKVGENLVSVGDNGRILISGDMGNTWNEMNSGTTNGLYCLNFADNFTGYAGGENGILMKTIDGGNTWEQISYGTILDPAVTKSTVNSISGDFKISQNYPNPFNPSTKIDFILPIDGFVSLKVYDISGKEIATLADGYMAAQKFSFSFDGSNLASGMYFYKINITSATVSFSKTMKMILTK